jgi:hypothetical protein
LYANVSGGGGGIDARSGGWWWVVVVRWKGKGWMMGWDGMGGREKQNKTIMEQNKIK